MSNKKVILSADSTCDLNKELKDLYNVNYYPFYVHYRENVYKDNVDLFPKDIFEGYYKDKSLPKTAASSIGEFTQHFKQFTDNGYEVIHISLGHGLSCAYNNAKLAADEMNGVYVIDSGSVSTGLGQLIIRAGKMINQGMKTKDIVDELERIRAHIHVSFVLDTLDFMAAGGRCPAVAAKAAGMLKCKPYLSVDNSDGSLHMGKMYRGKIEMVLKKYVKEELEKYNDVVPDDIFITHSTGFDSDEIIDDLEKIILETVPFENVHRSTASCAISSHCGPKCLGILFVTNWK